jgi:hypothetical protein
MPEEPWTTAHETCIAPESPHLPPIADEVTEATFAQALGDV